MVTVIGHWVDWVHWEEIACVPSKTIYELTAIKENTDQVDASQKSYQLCDIVG